MEGITAWYTVVYLSPPEWKICETILSQEQREQGTYILFIALFPVPSTYLNTFLNNFKQGDIN